MRLIEVNAVTCKRGITYDAEVQLRYGDYENLIYKQIFVSGGWPSKHSAKEHAQVLATAIENELISKALEIMSKYKEAKP